MTEKKTKGKVTSHKTSAKVKGGRGDTKKEGKLAKPLSEEKRKELLRKFLIKKREEIIKEAKTEIARYLKGETKQLVETALDDGDWSVIDLSEDINFKRLETHRENLTRIDEALRKLSEGTYGICEDCGEEIPKERLEVMPFAILCRDCQEKKEEMEKLEREEML
ncbi:MAG: TraR/DksA family transcriptional regulator [Thermodesulfovibrionales bacterium]